MRGLLSSAVATWTPGTRRTLYESARWCWEPSTGEWIVRANVAASGHTRVSMTVRDA